MHSALSSLQQQAQRRLLVEACLSDVDERKANSAEPDSGAAGAPAAGSEPCPSRDRARASLRRLHPTAWLCAEPAASSVAEPGVLNPASRLLQQAATAAAGDSRSGGGGLALCWGGKRLPWAHLAARERAAASAAAQPESIAAVALNQDAEPAAPGAKAADSWCTALGGVEHPVQDWSWLASPPWGVAPLPPELAARVNARGELRNPPPACTSTASAAAVPVAVAEPTLPPFPAAHTDLHRRLHRTAGAVQRLLAVAAAANTAATAAGGPLLYSPVWEVVCQRRTKQGGLHCVELQAAVHTATASWVSRLGGRPGAPPPARPAAHLCSGPEEQSWQEVEDFQADAGLTKARRIALTEAASRSLQSPSLATANGSGPDDTEIATIVMATWNGGRLAAQRLLKIVLNTLAPAAAACEPDGGGGGGDAGGSSGSKRSNWQRMEKRVLAWAAPQTKTIWRLLLQSAAAVEDAGVPDAAAESPLQAVADGASAPDGCSVGGSGTALDSSLRKWGAAAEEVLKGAACTLALMYLVTDQLHQVRPGGTTPQQWVPWNVYRLNYLDPLTLALTLPTFLLMRATYPDGAASLFEMYDVLLVGQVPTLTHLSWPPGGPAAQRSAAAYQPQQAAAAAAQPPPPPPPPLSYAHCLSVTEALAHEADVVYTWALAVLGDSDAEAVGEAQVCAWLGAWEAYRRQQRERRERRAERRNTQMKLMRMAWRQGGTHGLLSALRALPGEGEGEGEGDAVAELCEAVHQAAKALRLTGVMAAAVSLQPVAAALAAAVRGLRLLRIPPPLSAPVPPFCSAASAKKAAAGVAAAVGAPGGGCDVLRIRVPCGDAATAAAALLCLHMHGQSVEPAVGASGARFGFQPEPRSKRRRPQQQQQQQHQQPEQSREGHLTGEGQGPPTMGPQLDLEVCRTFRPLWDLPHTRSAWPYPWDALAFYEGVQQWNDATPLDAMVAHLRRFLVQLGTGICAAHVRGVEALGRTVAALAKVREELRDGAKGAAARDAVGCVATVIDFGDEPQSTAQTAADAAAAGCAADDTRPGVDGVEKGADEEDDSSVDGDYAEGGAGTPKQRRPRLGTLARAWDDTYIAAAEVEPLLPEERLQQELPSAATVAAADVAVAAAAAARAKPQRPEEERQRRRQQRLVDSDGGGSSGGGGAGSPLPPPPPLVLVEPRPGLSHQQLREQRGSDGAESVTSLEVHLANMVYLLQGQHVPAPAAAAATAQHQQGEEQPEEGGGRRRKEQQPQQNAPRQKQPWLDVELDVWFLEVAPGAPWQLMPPSKAVIQGLNRAMEKEKLARHAK
ncbi:hypothetical protein HYH02_009105 [Chlamydomonas schloesseri]|uniref:Uncharacterized protein n=1 Tax=Chlamydomonas schloesseri TaxID=2026947 RepID=A0A835WB84_9CHLO|nr:hypothetical protein HYH02_009105 [Chlamydomonas schloesseri]|eukprot:KAG2444166.1 hypothetical protein HYH02_009105 [Chlamydomonas schloesseri]